MKITLLFLVFLSSISFGRDEPQEIPIKIQCQVQRDVVITFSPNEKGAYFDGKIITSFDARENINKEIILKKENKTLVAYVKWL
ncbi:hypothetical protein [Aeromonas salmonicida]|uniref:hypothetical protein n=1 Tax=Aeromonas salmonicida TaxID=645 RepID=UPI003D1DCFE1